MAPRAPLPRGWPSMTRCADRTPHCPRHGYMTSIARIAGCFRVRHVTACDPPPPLVASTYMFLSLCVRDRLFAPPPPQVEVKQYFNNEGFDRWSRIYSEDGEVNSVQLDIRNGHAITVDKVLGWVDADGTAAKGETFCDAGCGVGSLSLPLAKRGATVVASDISAAMVEEATKRAETAGLSDRATFSTSDLEAIEGKYDTVTCIDVMIHYPQDKMAQMVQGLASKADKRLIISFAPDVVPPSARRWASSSRAEQDDARVPPHGGGRRQGAGRRLRAQPYRDDGDLLLLLAPARGGQEGGVMGATRAVLCVMNA